MSNVENKIYEMLTENTGKHFLDSGFNNNRHWERNQKKTFEDFRNEPEQNFEVITSEINPPEISRTVSLFHYLAGQGSNLELDSICNKFNKLNENFEDLANCEPYGVGVDAWEYLKEYINEDNIRVFNTYNSESDLSQTLQGATLELFIDGQYEYYTLIQIHGGADVRGGYTNAVLFKCEEGVINEYLFDYMDSYQINEELEYINEFTDYYDENIIYREEQAEEIKKALMEN